jgi:hypothetical protein
MSYSDFEIMWKSSEVFRNYAQAELSKPPVKPPVKTASTDELLEQLLELQEAIKKDANLKQKFINMQRKIASDINFAKQLPTKFVEALSLLDLEDA